MTRELDQPQTYTFADERVYDQLRAEMDSSVHGGLFAPRPLDDDPMGLFHLDHAHVPPHDFDSERFAWLKENILWPFLITEDSFNAFVESLDETLQSEPVKTHVSSDENGSLAWVSNHISYADIAVLLAARTEVSVRHGNPSPTSRHHAIASRLISLFSMPLLKDGKQDGYVVEDGLLYLGGYLQTVPASAAGSRVKQVVTADINEPVREAYHRLLNTGSEFFLAASGTQDKPNEDRTTLVMDTVSHGTAGMLTQPNAVPNAERLLSVPVFMDCNPFTGGKFAGAVEATHAILSPRLLRTEDDVSAMMQEIAEIGTIEKRPGTLSITYRKPTVINRTIGRIGAGSEVYKD